MSYRRSLAGVPEHYRLTVQGTPCDVHDVVDALDPPHYVAEALTYLMRYRRKPMENPDADLVKAVHVTLRQIFRGDSAGKHLRGLEAVARELAELREATQDLQELAQSPEKLYAGAPKEIRVVADSFDARRRKFCRVAQDFLTTASDACSSEMDQREQCDVAASAFLDDAKLLSDLLGDEYRISADKGYKRLLEELERGRTEFVELYASKSCFDVYVYGSIERMYIGYTDALLCILGVMDVAIALLRRDRVCSGTLHDQSTIAEARARCWRLVRMAATCGDARFILCWRAFDRDRPSAEEAFCAASETKDAPCTPADEDEEDLGGFCWRSEEGGADPELMSLYGRVKRAQANLEAYCAAVRLQIGRYMVLPAVKADGRTDDVLDVLRYLERYAASMLDASKAEPTDTPAVRVGRVYRAYMIAQKLLMDGDLRTSVLHELQFDEAAWRNHQLPPVLWDEVVVEAGRALQEFTEYVNGLVEAAARDRAEEKRA